MASDAQRKANAKYLASKKSLTIRVDPDQYERIRVAAAEAGLSVQKFMLTLVFAYLNADTDDMEGE